MKKCINKMPLTVRVLPARVHDSSLCAATVTLGVLCLCFVSLTAVTHAAVNSADDIKNIVKDIKVCLGEGWKQEEQQEVITLVESYLRISRKNFSDLQEKSYFIGSWKNSRQQMETFLQYPEGSRLRVLSFHQFLNQVVVNFTVYESQRTLSQHDLSLLETQAHHICDVYASELVKIITSLPRKDINSSKSRALTFIISLAHNGFTLSGKRLLSEDEFQKWHDSLNTQMKESLAASAQRKMKGGGRDLDALETALYVSLRSLKIGTRLARKDVDWMRKSLGVVPKNVDPRQLHEAILQDIARQERLMREDISRNLAKDRHEMVLNFENTVRATAEQVIREVTEQVYESSEAAIDNFPFHHVVTLGPDDKNDSSSNIQQSGLEVPTEMLNKESAPTMARIRSIKKLFPIGIVVISVALWIIFWRVRRRIRNSDDSFRVSILCWITVSFAIASSTPILAEGKRDLFSKTKLRDDIVCILPSSLSKEVKHEFVEIMVSAFDCETEHQQAIAFVREAIKRLPNIMDRYLPQGNLDSELSHMYLIVLANDLRDKIRFAIESIQSGNFSPGTVDVLLSQMKADIDTLFSKVKLTPSNQLMQMSMEAASKRWRTEFEDPYCPNFKRPLSAKDMQTLEGYFSAWTDYVVKNWGTFEARLATLNPSIRSSAIEAFVIHCITQYHSSISRTYNGLARSQDTIRLINEYRTRLTAEMSRRISWQNRKDELLHIWDDMDLDVVTKERVEFIIRFALQLTGRQ